MSAVFKARQNGYAKSMRDECVFRACSEVLDRAATLETLVRSSIKPLLVDNVDQPSDNGGSRHERYLCDLARLTALRREFLFAELTLDASLIKLASLVGLAPEIGCLDGNFLRKLDTGISSYSDTFSRDSSPAVQHLSANFLIKEGSFPFGDLFEEKEVTRFFGKLRGEIEVIIKGLFQ